MLIYKYLPGYGSPPNKNVNANRKRGIVDTSDTQIHDHPLSFIDTGTLIKNGGVKLFLGAQIYPLSEMNQIQNRIIMS
jgi:hypothetical protein